jgi:hypothetical protein
MKKFKSHRRVGGMPEILEAIWLQEWHDQARSTYWYSGITHSKEFIPTIRP